MKTGFNLLLRTVRVRCEVFPNRASCFREGIWSFRAGLAPTQA
jgi:hypothetical protein